MSEQERAKAYDEAWVAYDNEVAALKKQHRDAYATLEARFKEGKAMADKTFGTASGVAWQKFREKTGRADP